jgi:hypothetical protein
MAALSARESIRYGVRLFGYLLVTTIIGGGLLGGGVVLGARSDAVATLTGTSDGSTVFVAAAVVLSLLGVLAFAAGLFLVGFVTVTDAVRLGIDRSSLGPSVVESVEPDTTESETDESAASGEDPNSTGDPLGGGGSDPFDDRDDSFDEPQTEDPLGRTDDQPDSRGDPARRQAGPAREDDEAWRREIEAKLDDED